MSKQSTVRKNQAEAPAKKTSVNINIAELKAVEDVDLGSGGLPSLGKTLPKEKAKQLRKAIEQGGNSALLALPKSGKGNAIVFDLTGTKVRSQRASELVRERVGPSNLSMERLAKFAGGIALDLMPLNAKIVVSPGGVINGRFNGAQLIKPIQLAMLQMPAAPQQEGDKQGAGTKQGIEKSKKLEPTKSVAEQFKDVVSKSFSEKELGEMLKQVSERPNPEDREFIGAFVKPAHYSGSKLVPDQIVLQPMRVDAKDGDRFEVSVTKESKLEKADIANVRKALGVSDSFPLDAKFSRDLTDKQVFVTPAKDSLGNSGLKFNIDRFDVGGAMKTVGFIQREQPDAKPVKTNPADANKK